MSKLQFIHLNEINEQPKELHFESFEDLGGEQKQLSLRAFDCKIKIHKAGDGFYLKGSLSITRDFPCTLCGKESFYSQDIKIQDFLRIDPKFDIDELHIAKSDESNSLVVRSSQWNLKEFIRELVILEEPIQFYSHDGNNVNQCPEYENLVKKGILAPIIEKDDENKGNNPFEALKNLRF